MLWFDARPPTDRDLGEHQKELVETVLIAVFEGLALAQGVVLTA
ncbi:MAG: hypothetical protein ACOYBJ_02100 [Patescibacteria group bacterium]